MCTFLEVAVWMKHCSRLRLLAKVFSSLVIYSEYIQVRKQWTILQQ